MQKSYKFNSNHSNLAFEEQVTLASILLKKELISMCGYTEEILHDRLMQRLVEISYKPYASRIKKSLIQNIDGQHLPGKGEMLDCGRAFLQIGSGKIIVTARQWIRNQYDFLKHWIFGTISIFHIKSGANNKYPVTLVFGIGDETLFKNESDIRFVNYCHSGQIEPLAQDTKFIIESNNGKTSIDPDNYFYCKWPLINLLYETKLGFLNRLQLLFIQFIIFFEYLIASFQYPQLTLIAKDFAYGKTVLYLDKHKLINSIVLTCSNYTEQPLFTRGLENTTVHMVWYAQAWKPVTYLAAPTDSDVPNLRWIRADIHWVWTRSFSNYLIELGIGDQVKVVGPIVWYIPDTDSPEVKIIRIAVFDAPPFSDEVALGNGQITNYHHPDNLTAFIKDLILIKAAIEQEIDFPVELILKTKRGYNILYDKQYYDYLDKLILQDDIKLVHHSENLYKLISGSNLVIAYPFTSPAYIADYLRVPSIYYDPTGTVVHHDFSDTGSLIHFCSNYTSLLETTCSLLRVKNTIAAQ